MNCVDVVWLGESVWSNPIMPYFFEHEKIINDFIPLLKVVEDPEIFLMSEKYYEKNWQFTTGKTYENFGKPFHTIFCGKNLFQQRFKNIFCSFDKMSWFSSEFIMLGDQT